MKNQLQVHVKVVFLCVCGMRKALVHIMHGVIQFTQYASVVFGAAVGKGKRATEATKMTTVVLETAKLREQQNQHNSKAFSLIIHVY